MSRLLPLFVVVASLGCAGAPGEITSAFPEILPANGKIVVFMRPPLDVVFESALTRPHPSSATDPRR